MDGLLTRWHNSETLKVPSIADEDTERMSMMYLLDTVKVQAISTDCAEIPIVRPKPDDFLFGVDYHRSLNLGLIIAFYVMFFVFFAVMLWLFS